MIDSVDIPAPAGRDLLSRDDAVGEDVRRPVDRRDENHAQRERLRVAPR